MESNSNANVVVTNSHRPPRHGGQTTWYAKWALLLIVARGLLYLSAINPSNGGMLVEDDQVTVAHHLRNRSRPSLKYGRPSAASGYDAALGPPSRNAYLPTAPPSSHSRGRYRDRYRNSTAVDLVSLTVVDDFFVLFNQRALASWLLHIRNVRSVTFVGPPGDYAAFLRHMAHHYPQLLPGGSSGNGSEGEATGPPVRWANETHWRTTYQDRHGCPYDGTCQQLIKLHVFDLRTHLGLDIGDNVLIVDSDTVWSRNATFVRPDGRVQYFAVTGPLDALDDSADGAGCTSMDPVQFTEALTIGSSLLGPRRPTLSPYLACRRPEHPAAVGARHIAHHMLFQRDIMGALHAVVVQRWNASSLWEAATKCHRHTFCKGRMSEYELYFAFALAQYPEQVRVTALANGRDYMASSAECGMAEMRCCRELGVLLKGCHYHRIRLRRRNATLVGDMCCPASQ